MEKEEVEKDIANYAKLESLALSEGGKLLTDSLKKDVDSCVDRLISGYKTKSHIELIAIIAQLETKTGMLKAIGIAGKNKKIAKEVLDNLNKEE